MKIKSAAYVMVSGLTVLFCTVYASGEGRSIGMRLAVCGILTITFLVAGIVYNETKE